MTSTRVNAELGCEVFFKCENLQRVGAFKFRGAYNALSRFTPTQRERGVVTFSSGNHAQAIALAARTLDIPVTVVMPSDAPTIKREATAGYGATIVPYDRYADDREQIGRELAQRDGLTLIPPYDHADVIAGQGTAALELCDDAPRLDALFVPLGGGGLLSGTLLVAREKAPHMGVFGVEPQTGDDGRQSLRAGHVVHIDPPRSIADGALTSHLGELTFPIIQRGVSDILTATDPELVDAMASLASTLKIVVEPTGCLGFAALRAQRNVWAGRKVGVILSGGNIDLRSFAHLLAN